MKFTLRLAAILALFAFMVRTAQAQHSVEKFDKAAFEKVFRHEVSIVNGIKMHYVIGGKGAPIVLLHGYPQTWYEWHKVMPALAEHYTVVAPDLRGLGDTQKTENGYEKRNLAEDVHQLMESLKFKNFYLVGHDMGGAVAYALAAQYPDTVRRFVFIESGIPGFGLEEAEDITHGGSWHFGFFMTPDIPEMLTKGKEKSFLTEFAYKGHFVYKPGAISDADIAEYVRHYAAPGGMKAGFAYYRALPEDAKQNQAAFKTKLTMPVLAVGGDKSFGEFPRKNMENVAENVRGVIIKDCAHFVAEEQPEEFLRQIFAFDEKN